MDLVTVGGRRGEEKRGELAGEEKGRGEEKMVRRGEQRRGGCFGYYWGWVQQKWHFYFSRCGELRKWAGSAKYVGANRISKLGGKLIAFC